MASTPASATPDPSSVATANVESDYASTFGDLGNDVLGKTNGAPNGAAGLAGGAEGLAAAQLQAGKAAPEQFPFLAFDFRRGAGNWPEGATVIEEPEAIEALREKVRGELAEQLNPECVHMHARAFQGPTCACMHAHMRA